MRLRITALLPGNRVGTDGGGAPRGGGDSGADHTPTSELRSSLTGSHRSQDGWYPTRLYWESPPGMRGGGRSRSLMETPFMHTPKGMLQNPSAVAPCPRKTAPDRFRSPLSAKRCSPPQPRGEAVSARSGHAAGCSNGSPGSDAGRRAPERSQVCTPRCADAGDALPRVQGWVRRLCV